MVFKYDIDKRKERIKKLKILDINLKNIFRFIDDQASIGNSKARQMKYLSILGQIGKMLDYDFSKASKDDIKKLCSKINNSNLSDWTKHDYLLTIKLFYRFLKDTEEYPKEVKWIKPTKAVNHKKLPRDLLTIEDTNLLANSTLNLRDRCFIIMLYESGARINELLELKLRDIESNEYGVKVTLPDNGKTGPRKITLIASAPAISNWLMEHPKRSTKSAPLFCGIWSKNIGKPIDYRTLYEVLKDARTKSGIDKPVNPHHFRHSRATELAKKLTEAQLCKYMGWVIGSKEAATYVHLSGRDLDDAILELYGLKKEEDKIIRFKPINCPRCKTVNDPSSKFCSQCSLGLDEKTIIEYDKQKEQATKMGLGLMESSQSTQDKINQALLDELKLLREKVETLEKQKK